MLQYPLFDRYPSLAEKLRVFSIGNFPTPVEKVEELCREFNHKHLYIKRDDLSAVPYGGNKVRKLELLLGDALAKGATRVITSGAAGSNHALATGIYAKKAGLKATLMLFPQPASIEVQQNLLMDLYFGAEVVYDETFELHRKHISIIADHYLSIEKTAPYVIPGGGSSPVGLIGYVNAGFELRRQIDEGRAAEPSAIFVAFGTTGTAAGLLLGLKAANIKSKLIMIRVVPPVVSDISSFKTFYDEGNSLLHNLDPSFPELPVGSNDVELREEYFGGGYGISDERSRNAIAIAEKTSHIHLDGTYTGKVFAAFLDEARSTSAPLLFWNTKNSNPFPADALSLDYHKLPLSLHHYFAR